MIKFFVWDACGYKEFYNPKQRCRIINSDRLLQALAIPTLERFRKWHTLTLDVMPSRGKPEHFEFWFKAFAVGEEDWLKAQLKTAGIKRMKIKNRNDISFAIGETP